MLISLRKTSANSIAIKQLLLAVLLTLGWAGMHCLAQSQDRSKFEVTVQETFKPTFRIEPLVQRFSGRRGEIIPFRFLVESSSRDTEVEIIPIALRQDIDGKVLHVEDPTNDTILQISTLGKQLIQRDVPFYLEGLIRVPGGNTSFYSLGIMVRELSQSTLPAPPPNPRPSETRAGLKFITQYIVRIDLNVEGVPGEAATAIQLTDVKVQSVNGMPKLFAYVKNDTQSAFEFGINARLYSSPSDRTYKRMKLVMPVRESITDETRYVGRLFPETVLRMGANVEESLPTGEYNIDLELISDNRIIQRRTFSLNIDSLSFPAQEVKTASVGDKLYLSPGQIELSQIRGGQRRLTLEFINSSKQAQTIELEVTDDEGHQIADVLIQPTSFVLAPNSRRRIPFSMKSSREIDTNVKYGTVQVKSRLDGQDFDHQGSIPLAIIYNEPTPAALKIDTMRWVSGTTESGFKTSLYNHGESHFPVEARLTILAESGQRWTIPAGFGRWLMPGKEMELSFPIQSKLPFGNYELVCEVLNSEKPVRVRQLFQIGESNTKFSSTPVQPQKPANSTVSEPTDLQAQESSPALDR